MRTTKNISITITPTMLKNAEEVAKTEGRTMSELVREALRRYMAAQQWQEQWQSLRRYGRAQSKRLGLKARDVNRLIQEVRQEQSQK